MKFKHVLSSKLTLKKKKYFEFNFSEEDIKKGKKATYNKMHFCNAKGSISRFGLYMEKGLLSCVMFHTFDLFEQSK